jgi:hypothetical protein
MISTSGCPITAYAPEPSWKVAHDKDLAICLGDRNKSWKRIKVIFPTLLKDLSPDDIKNKCESMEGKVE